MTPLDIRTARLAFVDLLIAEKKHDEAKTILKRALEDYPGDIDALYRLGTVSLALGDTTTARKMFSRVLALADWHPEAKAALDEIAAAAAAKEGGPLPLWLRTVIFAVGVSAAVAIFASFFIADTWGVDKEKSLVCGLPTVSPTIVPSDVPPPTLGVVCDDQTSISATVTENRSRSPSGFPESQLALITLILVLSAAILLHPYLKSVDIPGGTKLEFHDMPSKPGPGVSTG